MDERPSLVFWGATAARPARSRKRIHPMTITVGSVKAPNNLGSPQIFGKPFTDPCVGHLPPRQSDQTGNSSMKKLMVFSAYFLFPILTGIIGIGLLIATGIIYVNILTSLSYVAILVVCIIYSFSDRQKKVYASIMAFSLILVMGLAYHFGFVATRAYAYSIERYLYPHPWSSCLTKKDMIIEDAKLQICQVNDFHGYFVDVIVRIAGNTPAAKILQDVHSGTVGDDIKSQLIERSGVWANSFTYQRISGDYYLMVVRLD